MPLTVRLDPTLERALERYCKGSGVSKSLVVQESLSAYLVARSTPDHRGAEPAPVPPSAHFVAFADAGLIGGGALGQGGDKAAVRRRAQQGIQRDKGPTPAA